MAEHFHYPPGFGPDPSFGNNRGITGFRSEGSALTVALSEAAVVTFTFFGKGDASLSNLFQVNLSTIFTGNTTGQGAQFTTTLSAGTVPFRFITGNAAIVNNGSSASLSNFPGFFAGVDPYTATTTFETSGTTVYLGLTDLPGGDHDFQDLVVRMDIQPIPEPTALVSAFLGLGCLAAARRARLARSANA